MRFFKQAKFFAALLPALLLSACQSAQPEQKFSMLGGKPLPESYYSPDGLTLGKDGYIYVSINQSAAKGRFPAKIARISPDDQISEFFMLPAHPKTGRAVPMGIVFAADGNLYVSDNQSFGGGENGLAGIMRVNIKDGKPQGAERIVSGMNASNGIAVYGNAIYIADSDLRVKDKNLSGVYRFSFDEFRDGKTVTVTGEGDPHLIISFETKNTKRTRGANGIGFDSKGNFYVNNFGDTEILKYTFNEQGAIATQELFARLSDRGALTVDGLQVDSEDNLWIADIAGNAIFRVSSKTGRVTYTAKSRVPSDGSDGAMDTPSECIRRGDKVYVSNIDLDIPPSVADSVQTITVISLK